MIRNSFFTAAVAILMSFCQGSSAHAAGPEGQLIEAVKVALGKNFNTDWSGLDALPGGGERCGVRHESGLYVQLILHQVRSTHRECYPSCTPIGFPLNENAPGPPSTATGVLIR